MAWTAACHAGVRGVPDLCSLLLLEQFPASWHLHQTGVAFSKAHSPCTSETKHSRLVDAQAQPGWPPIPSGLKRVGPVRAARKGTGRETYPVHTGEECCTSQGQCTGFSAPVCSRDSLAQGWLCLLYSLEAFVPLQKFSLSLPLS